MGAGGNRLEVVGQLNDLVLQISPKTFWTISPIVVKGLKEDLILGNSALVNNGAIVNLMELVLELRDQSIKIDLMLEGTKQAREEVYPLVSLETIVIRPGQWCEVKTMTDNIDLSEPQTAATVVWQRPDLTLENYLININKGEAQLNVCNVSAEKNHLRSKKSSCLFGL